MSKKYLIAALLLLPVGMMAPSAGQQKAYPGGSPPPILQPADPEQTQGTQASNAHVSLLEGCIEGSRDNLTLTDAAGKVFQLRGNIAELADHIGQQASVTGTETPRTGPGFAEGQPTFTVKSVKIIGRMCSASK
jgi:hypothetical protein